jgi:hypothetical protein
VTCEQRHIVATPTDFDPKIVTLRPTELGKRGAKCRRSQLPILVFLAAGHQYREHGRTGCPLAATLLHR